ncbi:uncharacterized protein PHALS_01203 [Plasmopara halstedii]|uniref:Uncharacterized protein n=1 Tax=Plasmopara halstedii TaxID=4781 RepID=A0A0P1AV26_PLAHL|nr:uncharacterized protein PHALS_01203 [Plasmopara halstedii]CEG44872.1 hypothetical protein PHALS_01203 [Plasmopara halstedii]|eukprot:XP_024581241.1 hypothetical protein PHALS_01203 [Plasmopara halstedii]
MTRVELTIAIKSSAEKELRDNPPCKVYTNVTASTTFSNQKRTSATYGIGTTAFF